MANVTTVDELLFRSTFVRIIAGLFAWAAVIITSYQVINNSFVIRNATYIK